MSAPNNEPTLRIHQKNDKKSRKKIEKIFLVQNFLKRIMSQLLDNTKNRKKTRKIVFGSELSVAINEPTFRIHQKNDKKSRKKNRKIIFGQNFLKRIMCQLLDNNNKMTKIDKNYFWLKIVH